MLHFRNEQWWMATHEEDVSVEEMKRREEKMRVTDSRVTDSEAI